MSARGSGRSRPFRIPEAVYTLIERMFVWGGAAFVIGLAYVAWGILSGRIGEAMHLSAAERFQITKIVIFACKILAYGGIACIIGAAARFYYEEVLGYLLLIAGAALYWGSAVVAGPHIQGMSPKVAELAVFAIKQLQTVGTIALALAVPFILMDLWAKLRGISRSPKVETPQAPAKVSEAPTSRLYLFCWQMPYCRDYLRKVCTAYDQRKPCWRIKSGCYCDENMILKVLQRSSTSKISGFDQRYSSASIGLAKNLTPAQKRERCRQCFLYIEHQKQKYRMISPLAFPAVIFLMWAYLKPVKELLAKALKLTDEFAGVVSFGPAPDQVIGNAWIDATTTSGIVEWLFIICIGMILLSYVLRAIEFAVFDLKV